MTTPCPHGQLARTCLLCECERRIAELEAYAERRRDVVYSACGHDANPAFWNFCPQCRIAELEAEVKRRKQGYDLLWDTYLKAEAALERVQGLQEYPAHVFLLTETRSDGQRTRMPQKAKVVLANELAAALKEEGK